MLMLQVFSSHGSSVRKLLDNMLYHTRKLAKKKEDMELGDGEKYRGRSGNVPGDVKEDLE